MRVAVLVLNYLFLSGLVIAGAFMALGLYLAMSGQAPTGAAMPPFPAGALWVMVPMWSLMFGVPAAASVTSLVFAHRQASK